MVRPPPSQQPSVVSRSACTPSPQEHCYHLQQQQRREPLALGPNEWNGTDKMEIASVYFPTRSRLPSFLFLPFVCLVMVVVAAERTNERTKGGCLDLSDKKTRPESVPRTLHSAGCLSPLFLLLSFVRLPPSPIPCPRSLRGRVAA